MFKNKTIAVAGSRVLSSSQSQFVGQVVSSLQSQGCFITVGCATGADQAAIQALSPTQGRVFAAFGQGGQGACKWSAVSSVNRFAKTGGRVTWWAGGPSSLCLAARLSVRTRAVAGAATALVAFMGSPASRGTSLACRVAVSRGMPVAVFPFGFAASALPQLANGSWVPASNGSLWSGAWVWEQRQGALFL